jgi:predicted negative regulator of RcsB-dependent stress response
LIPEKNQRNRRIRLDGYRTEDEQVELLRKWWGENGKSAIFGIVLGLSAIFGWREWQAHTISQTETASEIYQQALTAANQDKPQEARDKANELLATYGDTSYAVFARLILAQLAAAEEDYNTAEQQLNEVLAKVDNPSIKHEITLRLARVLIANNKSEQALTLLGPADTGAFTPIYNELKGDAYSQLNKPDEARQAYEQAIAGSEGAAAELSLLNIKLDALGK